jgi:hypothetical protein
MKKSIRKLTLRSETVRTLRPLRPLDLNEVTPVRGGDGAQAPRFESTGPCTDAALLPTQ